MKRGAMFRRLVVVGAGAAGVLLLGAFQFRVAGGPVSTVQHQAPEAAGAMAEFQWNKLGLSGPEDVPSHILGYEVVSVSTPANTACLAPGTVKVTLREPVYDPSPEAARQIPVANLLAQLPMGWRLSFVGPQTSREMIEQNRQRWNEAFRTRPCERLGSLQARAEPAQSAQLGMYAGFTLEQNGDPLNNSNLNYQGVSLTAPTVGASQNKPSYFLNNVRTDWSQTACDGYLGFFLQSGLQFLDGTGGGFPVWAASYSPTQCDTAQLFDGVSYVAGHNYYASIYYNSPGYWYVQLEDNTAGTLDRELIGGAGGSHLRYSVDTGQWLEVRSTNGDWWDNFTNPMTAYGAWESTNPPNYVRWSSVIALERTCTGQWSGADAISGSLANGQTASYSLGLTPKGC